MKTTTFAVLIAEAESKKRDAERRVNDAVRAVKDMQALAEAGDRTKFDAEESAAVSKLMDLKRAAAEDVSKATGELEALRKLEAEEAAVSESLTRKDPTYTIDRRTAPDDGPRWVRSHDQRPATVARGQRFAEQEIVAEHAARMQTREAPVIGQHGSFGNLVRSMTTTSGSALVPTVWASDIIDRARNFAAVLQAGAEVVPMDAKIVQIGRLTADPTAAFRAEGSTVTASDPTFDNVTLTATTMSALVVGSLEWFQDADNVDEVVSNAIAKAIALELDKQALFGGVVAGGETGATGFNTTFPVPPNPRGVLATLLAVASSNVLGSGANGTTQTAATYFAELLDTLYTPRYNNEQPTGMIANAKLFRQYAGAADTTNQPLRMPADLEALPKFTSNQIPSFTQGTMTTRATDVFVGDWAQCLIGQRLDVTVQTLTERYAELGQVGIIAHWRGDVQLARPRAFSVFRYLQGAA